MPLLVATFDRPPADFKSAWQHRLYSVHPFWRCCVTLGNANRRSIVFRSWIFSSFSRRTCRTCPVEQTIDWFPEQFCWFLGNLLAGKSGLLVTYTGPAGTRWRRTSRIAELRPGSGHEGSNISRIWVRSRVRRRVLPSCTRKSPGVWCTLTPGFLISGRIMELLP